MQWKFVTVLDEAYRAARALPAKQQEVIAQAILDELATTLRVIAF